MLSTVKFRENVKILQRLFSAGNGFEILLANSLKLEQRSVPTVSEESSLMGCLVTSGCTFRGVYVPEGVSFLSQLLFLPQKWLTKTLFESTLNRE